MVSSALELSVVEHWALGTVGVGTTVDVESVVSEQWVTSWLILLSLELRVLEHWAPSVVVSIVSAKAIRVGALVLVGVGSFCVKAAGRWCLNYWR